MAMTEVCINYNEVCQRENRVLEQIGEPAAEAVRHETLMGLIVLRRLKAAGIPVRGVLSTLCCTSGFLVSWQDPISKNLFYRWYSDAAELKRNPWPNLAASKTPVDDDDSL